VICNQRGGDDRNKHAWQQNRKMIIGFIERKTTKWFDIDRCGMKWHEVKWDLHRPNMEKYHKISWHFTMSVSIITFSSFDDKGSIGYPSGLSPEISFWIPALLDFAEPSETIKREIWEFKFDCHWTRWFNAFQPQRLGIRTNGSSIRNSGAGEGTDWSSGRWKTAMFMPGSSRTISREGG
jgi:hypothetical protein